MTTMVWASDYHNTLMTRCSSLKEELHAHWHTTRTSSHIRTMKQQPPCSVYTRKKKNIHTCQRLRHTSYNHHNLNFSTPTDTLHIQTAHTLQSQDSLTPLCMHGYTYCWRLDTAPHFYPLLISAFVVTTKCSFNPLSFTLAYCTLHIYGFSLIVKVYALAACSPTGSVCLYCISCYAQDEPYHLPPTPNTFHFGFS